MTATRLVQVEPMTKLPILLTILFFISLVIGQGLEDEEASTAKHHLNKEKLSHLRFYWHDIMSGPNPTSVPIVKPVSSNSPTLFGLVNIIDNPLTQDPSLTSKLLGRAQGFYASASQKELGLLMAMNFAFLEGKYNGSTLTVLGRNSVFTKVREMPVIGGTRLFRFARGYVEARTHTLNNNTGDAIVRYDCYVLHY